MTIAALVAINVAGRRAIATRVVEWRLVEAEPVPLVAEMAGLGRSKA